MALDLMYITNREEIAIIVEEAGVDRIWIDLEKLGKEQRQPGDTVKSDHSVKDVKRVKSCLNTSKLIVRVNPLNEMSKQEIDDVIESGADVVMLPYYKSVKEIKTFLDYVDGRVRTNILLETKEAELCLDETLDMKGIDEIHIGLNDLHISYNRKFMFELVSDGTVERICNKIKQTDISYGFGGIARLGGGLLPADYLISEHYRLGSERVILARSFCNCSLYDENPQQFIDLFKSGVRDIREYEERVQHESNEFFEANRLKVKECIDAIVG